MTQESIQPTSPSVIWFKALASAMRQDILRVIHERGIASPSELAELFGKTISTVTYHVRVLEKAELVEETHRLDRRGAKEHFFRVLLGPSFGGNDWTRFPPSVRRDAVARRAEEFVRKLIAALEYGRDSDDGNLVLRLLPATVVDDQGRERIAAILQGAQSAIEKVSADSIRRLVDEKAAAIAVEPVVVGLAAFRSPPLRTMSPT